MRITVLGAGAWGSTLGKLLVEAGHSVTLCGHEERLAAIRVMGRNERLLPGIDLPKELNLENDPAIAVSDAEGSVIAVPSASFRAAAEPFADFAGIAVTVTKGVEHETGLTMGGILTDHKVQHHANISTSSGIRRKPVSLNKPRCSCGLLKIRKHRIEALYVTHL